MDSDQVVESSTRASFGVVPAESIKLLNEAPSKRSIGPSQDSIDKLRAAKLNDFKPRYATSSLDPFHFDDELIPCNACCCFIESCFLKMPDCVGCHGSSVFCCSKYEFTCFKPGKDPEEYFVCTDGSISCAKPRFICKGVSQLWCYDSRYAFYEFEGGSALHPKLPCLVNILGITLCFNWMITPACCVRWGDLKNMTGMRLTKVEKTENDSTSNVNSKLSAKWKHDLLGACACAGKYFYLFCTV
jgi:hypothetical protein